MVEACEKEKVEFENFCSWRKDKRFAARLAQMDELLTLQVAGNLRELASSAKGDKDKKFVSEVLAQLDPRYDVQLRRLIEENKDPAVPWARNAIGLLNSKVKDPLSDKSGS